MVDGDIAAKDVHQANGCDASHDEWAVEGHCCPCVRDWQLQRLQPLQPSLPPLVLASS
jgi:hypothetical protein